MSRGVSVNSSALKSVMSSTESRQAVAERIAKIDPGKLKRPNEDSDLASKLHKAYQSPGIP
jgi:hypothetical protein